MSWRTQRCTTLYLQARYIAVGMVISIQAHTHTRNQHPSHIHTKKIHAHVQRGLTPCPLTTITQQHGSGRLPCSSICSSLSVFVIVYGDGLKECTSALYLRVCSSYMSIKGGSSIEQPNLSLNRDLDGALS